VIAFAVSSIGLAFLFSTLLNRSFEAYLPYLVTGLFIWNLIFGAVSEGPRILLDYRSLILQGQIPIAVYPLIANLKQAIVMLHGLPVLVVVLAITPNIVSPQLLWLIPGLLAIAVFCVSLSLILAITGAYFPDLAEVVSSGMRFVFFLTPVLWMAEQRPSLVILSHANPLYYILEAFRGPVLGTSDPSFTVMVAGIIAAATAIVAFVVARKFSLGSIVRI
jgi:ABC-type polysaccharide/polyol phosphate export permease